MKLYSHRTCPFSRRVRIALAEHGVDYQLVETAPTAAHPPELRGRTPIDAGVPVLLVREDFVLWDSAAIIYWLDSAYPRSLMPSSREPQALARAWVGWVQTSLYPYLQNADELAARVRALDSLVPDQGWLVGHEFSIADIAMAPALALLQGDQLERLSPKVRAYRERVIARPSVREVCELPAS